MTFKPLPPGESKRDKREDFIDCKLIEQDHRCGICSRKFSEEYPPYIDHDHNCCPGTISQSCGKCWRGLLCSNCNTGIGMLQDSIRVLASAIVWLQDHPTRIVERGLLTALPERRTAVTSAPAIITIAYRRIPTRVRRLWNPGRGSNSHIALAAIQAATSSLERWRLFFHFAIPHITLQDGIPWWLDGS